MHGVMDRVFTFHRYKSACTRMKGDVRKRDSLFFQLSEKRFGKVKPRRGSCNRTIHFGVNGLVAGSIRRFRFSLQIGWNGGAAKMIQNLSKSNTCIIPLEANDVVPSCR